MSNSNNRMIDARTHGLSRTYLVRTRKGAIKPEPITCFASYKVHTRPLIDQWVPPSEEEMSGEIPRSDEGMPERIRLHFTYSRNNGPIQRVMIDENTEDWEAVDSLYIKLDNDLCRAQDGESLAFYLLSDTMGVMEQVIPELNDNFAPPIMLPPIATARMVMSEVPEQPTYDYTITGISGDGLIPINGVFNADAREIAIPQPMTNIDMDNVTAEYPRWYPSNDIVKEENTIVIYPSDNVDDFDFDLFKVLGGEGNTPITINSCVKAVPRKYICQESHVVGSQTPSMMPTMMAMSASNERVIEYREPNMFPESPFPLTSSPRGLGEVSWPPPMDREVQYRGHDWIATYQRNDGPIKNIAWNTGTRDPGAHHSVWDAIKELLLDDYGRTAFMLSEFNSMNNRVSAYGTVIVKSGLGSDLSYTTNPVEPGEPLNRSRQPYRFSGKSVEIRDKQIRFADKNAGAVWNENTITIYPTSHNDANESAFDGYSSDYYDYLCQYVDQKEVGEPITIHSCAAVEPDDHIQVNTGFKVNMGVIGDVMPSGLIGRIQINDGEIKEFANEGALMEKTLGDVLNYVTLIGADPIVTSNSEMGDNSMSYSRAKSKTNLLYFKATMFGNKPAISGCSGTERPSDPPMELMTIDLETQKMEMLQVEILDEMDSDIPRVRTSNKVTFHRAVGTKYADFFDFIVGAKGDTHTIYSSAGVPCLLHGNPVDGDGEGPDDSDLPDGIPLRFTVNNPDNSSGDMPFSVSLTTFNPDYTWSIYKDGKLFVDANTIPEDTHVRDDNYFAGVSTYSTSVTLPMQRNTINEYLIYSDVNSVEITSNGKSDEINPRAITVIEFSDSITEHLFPSNYILFTVPNELPTYLRSTKSMFFNNKLFNQDISGWDTSNIVDMNAMFGYASSFDQDISHWDVSNVAGMESMFTGATSFNQNLSGWSVSNIPSVPSGFIYSTDSWILPKPVWGTSPLAGVLTEPEIPLTFNVDTDVSIKITVSDVSTGDWKLFKNDVLIARPGISRDGSSVNISSSNKLTVVISTSTHVGLNEYKLYAEGNAVLIDESRGELTDEFTITEFSNRCKEVIVGFSKAKVVVTADLPSSITSTLGMFRYCEIFNSDISHWDVSNVTNMDYMFHWARTFNQDLSKWCVSNIPSLPLGFDLDATAWTKPKPVWGTCPERPVDYTHFTHVSSDNSYNHGTKPIDVTIKNPTDGVWSIYKNGVLAADQNGSNDSNIAVNKNDYGITYLTLKFPKASETDFKIYGTIENLTLAVESSGGSEYIGATTTLHTFSTKVAKYLFNYARNNIVMPETVPPHLTDFSSMFSGCRNFNQDLTGWDTSNVTNMKSMFYGCTMFNGDIRYWDVSNVTNMDQMLSDTPFFNRDLSNWCVTNIPERPTGFSYNERFEAPKPVWGTCPTPTPEREFDPAEFNLIVRENPLYISNFGAVNLTVSDDCTDWKVYLNGLLVLTSSSADDTGVSATKRGNQIWLRPLQRVNTISVAGDMDKLVCLVGAYGGNPMPTTEVVNFSETIRSYVFKSSVSTLTLPDTIPSVVTSMNSMFKDVSVDVSDISGWDVSNVTDMDYMFQNASKFNQDLSGWCVSNIPSLPLGFDLDATAWTKPKPVWGTCPGMPALSPSDFGDLQPLAFTVSSTGEELVPGYITAYVSGDNSKWELRESGVVVAKTGYRSASVQIIAETADNKNIRIFVNPGELKHYALYASAPTLGLAVDTNDSPLGIADVTVTSFGTGAPEVKFDMGYSILRVPNVLPKNITSCSWMFRGSKRIETDITGWSMSHVTNTEFMFSEARNFNQDIGGWDTGNVVVMNNMFNDASTFNQDISGWDTSKVTNMWSMFAGASAFNQPIGIWNVGHVVSMNYMFQQATAFNQDLSGWNVSLIPDEPNYFRRNANSWTLPQPIWGTDGSGGG